MNREFTPSTAARRTVRAQNISTEIRMKNSSRFCLTLSCIGLLSVALVPVAHAEFKCDPPQITRADATACVKAAESMTSLRQYVSRTRMIYGLLMTDYVRPEEDAPKAPPERALQASPRESVARVAPPSR